MIKDFIKKNYLIILLFIVIIAFVSYFAIRNYMASKTIYEDSTFSDSEYSLIPKTYDVNEYTNIIVSESDMAALYLRDYLNAVNNDIDSSYSLVNIEYRNKKFSGIDDYKEYIQNLEFSYSVGSYYTRKIDKEIIFCIYDATGNFFAFKTNGVMQYSVYLDSSTIEIW